MDEIVVIMKTITSTKRKMSLSNSF